MLALLLLLTLSLSLASRTSLDTVDVNVDSIQTKSLTAPVISSASLLIDPIKSDSDVDMIAVKNGDETESIAVVNGHNPHHLPNSARLGPYKHLIMLVFLILMIPT